MPPVLTALERLLQGIGIVIANSAHYVDATGEYGVRQPAAAGTDQFEGLGIAASGQYVVQAVVVSHHGLDPDE